ncbi:MAG: putative spermidine/putrescine transport system permease protein [Thermomicrobiales bacterium]|jgi:putative spermidine/putrescine transport system permease protein|nr:putative spermidine/putrescine transport system permease protein [Thermomicrobiales bacterium]MEA2527979.1 putative spermidine/putrescine transport system permease protein [Thermomicrobiales bacterium]MEA2594503.1 putative spermidine/putrescine transport system permease protein [Thermomicrobiales bacterium]
MAVTGAGALNQRQPLRVFRLIPGGTRTVLLVLPATAIFVIFFIVPTILLLAIAFNPSKVGVVDFSFSNLTLETFQRFFNRPLYWQALVRSVELSVVTAVLALLLGYPLSYFVAKEQRPGRANLYMILILSSMQLDLIIRMYGLMILMGDTGLINDTLLKWNLIDSPLPLMYNQFGVIVGMVQLALPFMILSLIGVIQGIEPSLEEAARSLGASRLRTFLTITFPMSMPGVLAGSLLVFAIAVGSYAVPVLMGGWRVIVTPMHIYQQVSEVGNWRFAAAIACLLFGVSLAAVFVYHRYTQKYIGGLV